MLNQVSYLWNQPRLPRLYQTAISLHGHTHYSKESLAFIPGFACRRPLLRWLLAQQERQCAIPPDFSRAYWTPPMTPRAAYEVERQQIEEELGLASIVSLTDHDNIEAPQLLQVLPQSPRIPVSVEWSVPFGTTLVHLGVHNLPKTSAQTLLQRLAACTREPRQDTVSDLLAMLNSIPDVLIVFNHPMWDLKNAGKASHRSSVEHFLSRNNEFLHAFELGGLRGWKENQEVVELAHAWKQPVIAGGDRHGAEPSANLNLTNASSFAEFAEEVRRDRRAHVLFMPQYQSSLVSRMLQTVCDVIREYPGHPLGRTWDQRVFHADANGVMQPLAALWRRPPAFIEAIFALFRLHEISLVSRLALAVGRSRGAFRLPPLGEGGEAA